MEIIIPGLAERVTAPLLRELVGMHVPIRDLRLPVNPLTGKHRGTAFLDVYTREDGERCLRGLPKCKLFGRSLIARRIGRSEGAGTMLKALADSSLSQQEREAVAGALAETAPSGEPLTSKLITAYRESLADSEAQAGNHSQLSSVPNGDGGASVCNREAPCGGLSDSAFRQRQDLPVPELPIVSIQNLPGSTSRTKLTRILSHFGPFMSLDYTRTWTVQYFDNSYAMACIRQLDGQMIDGRQVHVERVLLPR